jgi:hypothetical protein
MDLYTIAVFTVVWSATLMFITAYWIDSAPIGISDAYSGLYEEDADSEIDDTWGDSDSDD